MKLSRAWLTKFFDAPLPSAAELAEALTLHTFEVEGTERISEDEILDVKVMPNRGDCLSHRGIAKELSAILQIPLGDDPLAEKPTLKPLQGEVAVTIEEELLCKRYMAGFIRGVRVGPSPAWLRNRLESIGQRSINNVVDATNFVMFSIGQPLHAFDASKLEIQDGSYGIAVRTARAGETLFALDGKVYEIPESVLVIADAHSDSILGIAGIKGGMPSGISEGVLDIIIEAAHFDAVAVRKASALLKLRTDASSRFEHGVSPELPGYGMSLVIDLILKVAGGEFQGVTDIYPHKAASTTLQLSLKEVQSLLGTTVTNKDIEEKLSLLGFEVQKKAEAYSIVVPFERQDITLPEDLIEEVGRLVGYTNIPSRALEPFPKSVAINARYYGMERIRAYLSEEGFSEVYTSTFTQKGSRSVLNSVDSTRAYLRPSLMEGLETALERNMRNKEYLGLQQIRLFEIGTIWDEGKETLALGLAVEAVKKEKDAGAFLSELLHTLKAVGSSVATGSVVVLPLNDAFEHLDVPDTYGQYIPVATKHYEPFSKYPYIVRDVALWVPADVEAQKLLEDIQKEAGELAIKVMLFDRFEKEGKVSLAYRLIFQSFTRTLTEEEVEKHMRGVYAALEKAGYTVR